MVTLLCYNLIFITLVLASIALALDVIEKSKTITVSTNYHEKLTIEKGVYLGLVGGSFHNFYSDVKVHGGLYVSTDDSSIRKNNRLVGNFENYFNTVIDLKRDTVSNSYIWEGESFENMGNMSMRGTPFASSNSQSLTFSYFSNSGFLQFVDTGYLQFGKEDGTLINTGTIAAQSDQFNHIYLIPQSSMMGNGCLWVGGYCIFHIEDLDNISVEDQTIVLSSEPNAILLGGFTDPPSRHPPVTSLKIRNFNSKTSIWFHDNNPKIKSFENGILTVTTIGRKYILDVGPGYTGDQFSMTNTPVTTQLWQEGRPINAGVLRTTKVKPTLSAYPGCLPPQSIPDFNSFKTLPFRDAESLPNGRTTVTSSRISSSVVGSLSKTIITTSISSSTADNQHVDVSSNFPSRTASETATVFFSFSSSDYSSQPSDYIASASSGIDGQTVTKPTGYTFLDSSSQPSSYVTSGLDTTSYQSSLDGSQSVNVLSNFTTKVSSYSTLISSDTTFAQYTSGVLSTSNSLSSNDAISRFTETTTQSISSSSQYFSNYVDQLSNEVTVIPLTTTTSQSTGEVVAQSSGYVFSLLSGNNTQLTSKEALSTSFDSSVATKFATLSTYKQSSDYLNSETATAPPFLSSSTISFPGSGEFKSHSLNQSLSVTNLLSSSQTAFGGNSLGQFKSQTPSGSSTTVAPQPGSPTLTLLSSSTAAENSAPKEALSPTSFPDMTTRVSGGATPNVSTVTSLLTDSADDEHTSTITQISSFSDNSDINIATPSLSCSSNQFSKHASPSPISNIVTQWESTPDSPSLCTITSACSSAVITVHYSNLTQYAASTLAAEYFTRSSPTSFESGNSRSTLDSVKTDLMSFSNQPSSNPSITTSSQVSTGITTSISTSTTPLTSSTSQPLSDSSITSSSQVSTGITTSVSASSQSSSGSLIASSSEISTSTTPLTSSTSQPLSDSSITSSSQVSTGITTSVGASSQSLSGSLIASSSEISTSTTPLTSTSSQSSSDSSIIFPSQVSTGTTTSVSASSKFSHTLTTGSPTDIVSKSSDISSPSSSNTVTTVSHSNNTQHASSTLAAEYFTRSSPTSFESGNSRSTLDSVKTDLMSFSNQPSSNPSITTSSQVSTGITTSVSASSQPSSGSLIASSSEISTSTTPLTSSTSQPLSDSSIIFPSQVSTGTTTSVSASSKFSHTLTTDSPTDIVSKSSDIPSPSSSNTVTTVSHSNNTQHASSTLAAEYFIRGSSSFLESDSSMFALQSTYTSLLSVSNQPSGDSRIPSSSQISTDITTLTSSISEISHTVATESLTNSASQPSSRTAIEVFIRSGRESSSAVAPRTSNIISGPSSSTYSLSSRDNILYSSTILVPFASSDLLESLKKNSSGSVASSGQSSALSVHSTLTDPTLVNPPMQSSRILTTKSASHIVSYSLTLSTFDSLNKGNTVIPIHPTVEKLASSTVSTSRHGSTSASHISDSQYLNKANYTTAQQVVQSSSLSSFEPNISNSFSTLTTFTTIYKEWTGTFISTYSTQVSTLNVNKARMVERAVGDSGSRVTIEIIYYVETPKANEALLTINANNGAASSQTIGNIATVTSCSSYVYTGVVSPAVISTVTTKIGDAITELTTWCPFSMPDSADKTIETFVTSSLLNVHTDLASTTTKHTSVPTANSNTVTKDMTLRPSFGTELVFGTTRGTDIAVTLESIKTAIPQNTTPGTKTHESSPSPASKATTPTTYGSAAVIIPEFSVSSTNVPSSESSLVTVQSGLTTSFMNSPRSWSYSSSVIASNSTSFQLSRYAGTANNLVSNGLWSVFVSTVLLAFYR
ncbi:AVB_G0017420.mRNA.1.CDS.1 [Saccharomyces cerevisiae]|nr:AVB_G0017420.mRNA.1.CDS.1 [Saccharomyces cerevisiae]CAI7110789.1 AVB_G0017420.mRNA.1.CDS.1 [Saccharomyces cerevisiae]